MGTIKINNETASEPIDMKRDGSNTKKLDFEESNSAELIMPIEHYVTVSAKVEKTGESVEGVKSAPRKKAAKAAAESGVAAKSSAGRKKALALPAGSIGAAVLSEKEKATGTGEAAGVVDGVKKTSTAKRAKEATGANGANGVAKKSANLAMDGMVKPKESKAKVVEVAEMPMTAEEEFEAHRPKEKKSEESEEPEEKGEPRFSKPKAVLIGAGVALVVAIVGGLVIGLMGRKEPERCMVQFESNGGSKIESEEVVCGEMVARPGDPTKEGFQFQNWIFGGAPFDFEQMTIDEDMILVAKWQVEDGTEIVKVSFDTDGGTEIDAIEVKKGGTISEPVEPTRESYEFVGWRLGDEDFDFEAPVEEDITLVAQWKPVAGGSSASHPNTPNEKPGLESLAVADNTVVVGTPKRFDITIKPANANHKLAVTSSDESIATCSISDGARLQCEGKAPGEVTMTVRDLLSGKTAQFKMTVSVDVTFVEINKTTLSLTVGSSETLQAEITASGGATVAGVWTSNNPGIATVDANGKVTAVSAGTATITVTAGGISKSCTVTVTRPYTPPVTPDPDPVDPEPEDPKPNPEDPKPEETN